MDQQYEDFKKQVKDSSDIVDVIGGYISLQKKGVTIGPAVRFTGKRHLHSVWIRNDSFFTVTAVIPAEMYSPLYRK